MTKSGKQSPNWNVLDVDGAVVTRCTSRVQALSLLELLNTKLLLNEQPTIRQSDRDHRTESLQLSDQSIDSESNLSVASGGERESADQYTSAHCVVDLEDPRDAVEYQKAKGERLKCAIERFREKNPQPRVQLPRFISDLAEDIKRNSQRIVDESRNIVEESRNIVEESRNIVEESNRIAKIAEVAIGIAASVAGVDVRESDPGEAERIPGSVRLPKVIKQID